MHTVTRNVLVSLLAGAALFTCSTARAAVVDLINSSAYGKSWDNGSDWSNGQPAQAGNDYRVGFSPTNRSLRTPNNVSNPIFPGDSLTIYSTGTLGMKHNGNANIADLRLDGGAISSWVGNRTMGFTGALSVLSASKLNVSNTSDSRRIVIASQLNGSGNLLVNGADGNDYVALTNSANTYTGDWTVSGGQLRAQGAGSLGSGNVTIQSGGSIDVDYDVNNSADWTVDGVVVLDQNHTIGNLTIGTRKIADGTYSYTDLNGSYDANFANGGSGSMTVTGGAGPSVYELNTTQPYGTSWNDGSYWTNTADSSTGVVPGLGTVANVDGKGLRTPMASGTHTFWAELNMKAGSILGLKTSGTAVLYDGHLQGGTLSMSLAPNSTAGFGGSIAVDSDSNVTLASTGSDHRTMILSADFSGSGDLDVHAGSGWGIARLTGNNAGYSGDWLVRDYAILEAQSAGSLGTGAVVVGGNATLRTEANQSIASVSGGGGSTWDHTLGVASLTDLSIGRLRVGYDGAAGDSAQVTVTGGDVQIGYGAGDTLDVGWRASAAGGPTGQSFSGTLDLSAADSFTADVDHVRVGYVTGGSGQLYPNGTVVLSPNNTITADEIVIGHSTSVGLGGLTNSITFGATNTVNVDELIVGGSKGVGLADIVASGELNLRGKTGAKAEVKVGYQPVWTGGGANGTLDLSAGTFNATIGSLIIAEKEASGSGTTRGTVKMNAGTVTADTITMANSNGNGATFATFDLSGGTLDVGSITKVDGTANFNFTGGVLHVGTFGFDLNQDGGTLAAGNSPGTTLIGGDYLFDAGFLEVEINGLAQGSDPGYDFYDVVGDADLGNSIIPDGWATLQVLLRDGFAPVQGTKFDVLTAVDITIGSDFRFDDSQTGGQWLYEIVPGGRGEILQLTAIIPEPGTLAIWALLAIFGLAAAWRRRGRR